MMKAALIAVAAMLVVSACASSEDGTASVDLPGGSDVVEQPSGSESEVPMPDPAEDLPVDDGDAPADDPATSGIAEPGDPPPPADDSDSLVLGDGIPQAVLTAQADLAERLGVSQDVIDWVSHEEVDWPDGSLGCPQPGMVYTQAIVNGTLTVFEVDGVEYRYHAGGGREPFLCEQPTATEKETTVTLDPSTGTSPTGKGDTPTTTIGLDE
jgi:hypothetical protein